MEGTPMGKYVRPTIGQWLRPAMLGPWMSMSTAVTLYAAFGPEIRFIPRWGVWGIGMLAGTLIAIVYVLLQVLVDVVLLALKQRALTTGKNAWLASLLGPLVVCGAYAMVEPWTYYKNPWMVLAMLLAPILIVTIAVRLFAGTKIEKAK
jgi:hypothetical protein